MNVKESFLNLGHFKVNDGTQIRFWEDIWLGKKPLKTKFPALFNIVRRKHDTVAKVLFSPYLIFLFEELWWVRI